MRIWILLFLVLMAGVHGQEEFFGLHYQAQDSENVIINFSISTGTYLERTSELFLADKLLADIKIDIDNMNLPYFAAYLANESKIRCIFPEPLADKQSTYLTCQANATFIQYANFPIIEEMVTEIEDVGYTGNTRYIEADLSQMVWITESRWLTDDIYSNVFDIAEWVTVNIGHDFDMNDYPRTSQVFESRKANIMGLNVLFVSMCRSKGVPSRVVEGLVLRRTDQFDVHYWSEAYIGKEWVPFDLFYKQLGYIDASHVRFRTLENIDSPAVSKRLPQEKDIEVRSDKPEINANIVTMGEPRKNILTAEVIPIIDDIAYDSYNLIEVRIKNDNKYYVPTKVSLISFPAEIQLIGDYEKVVLLPPSSSKSVYYLVKSSNDLDKSFIYTINLDVELDRGENIEAEFEISKNGNKMSLDGIIEEFIEDTDTSLDKAKEIIAYDPTPVYPITEEMIESSNDAVVMKRKYVVTEDGNKITLTISPKRKMYDFMIYEEIPKCLAEKIDDIIFNQTNVRVINPDPLMVWEFDSVEESFEISYTLKEKFNISNCKDKINTIAIAREISGEYLKKSVLERYWVWILIGSILMIPLIIFAVIKFSKYSKNIKKRASGRDKESAKRYVAQLMSQGYTRAQIRQTMVNQGWSENEINAGLLSS